ncbi:HAD family hydrolase [Streptomyces qinglanensis]|uniref:HAD family hydrolase n=1 Tax=Streptomyces qinglanensis TaxID=943816 RepID=UPI003D721005
MADLQVFDMDGTLLLDPRTPTASLAVAREAGCWEEVELLEGLLAAGRMTHSAFAAVARVFWEHLTPPMVDQAFDRCRWLQGIEEVVADIHAHDGVAAVITMAPDFFAERLADAFGFDYVAATPYPTLPFEAPVNLSTAPDPEDKERIVRQLKDHFGIDGRTVAWGDGPSDAFMFRAADWSVALNPRKELPTAPDLLYEGTDLREPYRHVRAMLRDQATQAA